MRITLSLIKADVGSVGGHTKPSDTMFSEAKKIGVQGVNDGLLIDCFVFHTGDDIAFLMSHTGGVDNCVFHNFVGDAFLKIT